MNFLSNPELWTLTVSIAVPLIYAHGLACWPVSSVGWLWRSCLVG